MEIYVYAGIAEPYTCSASPLAYLGLDVYSPPASAAELSRTPVRTVRVPEALNPPVSDYAMASVGGEKIVIVGGQRSNGTWVALSQALVFDAGSDDWSLVDIAGTPPPSRMGHTLTQISPHQHLLYGGLSPNSSVLNSAYLLDTYNTVWIWLPLQSVGDGAPPRAYHVATRTGEGEAVVAYGMGEGQRLVNGESAFWAVRVVNRTGYWKPMGRLGAAGCDSDQKGDGGPPLSQPCTASITLRSPAQAGNGAQNTKSEIDSSAASIASPPEEIQASVQVEPGYASAYPSPAVGEAATAAPTASAALGTFPLPPPAQEPSPRIVAGAVMGAVASAAVIGLLVMHARRRAFNALAISPPERAAPVTNLYTRPTARRLLTRLGSRGGGPGASAAATARGALGVTRGPSWGSASGRNARSGPGAPTMPTSAYFREVGTSGAAPSLHPAPPAPTAARAPSLRQPSQSCDSQFSATSARSYPYLRALMPQRSRSSQSSASSQSSSSGTDRTSAALVRASTALRPPTEQAQAQVQGRRGSTVWLGKMKPKLEVWMGLGSGGADRGAGRGDGDGDGDSGRDAEKRPQPAVEAAGEGTEHRGEECASPLPDLSRSGRGMGELRIVNTSPEL